MLYSFSIRRNMELLLKRGSNPKTDVINGMKWFCMLLIIAGHRLLYSVGLAHYNNENWELVSDTTTAALINNYSVKNRA